MLRKVLIRKAGSYERLEIVSAEVPKPGPGEVLVKSVAAGVNFADCFVRMGLYASAKEYVGWPITPGFEFSGTVEALGEGVTGLSVGDEVFGVMRFGAYASHVVTKRELVFKIPKGMTTEEAAGFPAVFLTAYFPLFEQLRVRKGSRVLVHSAAGGVGTALVQLAKVQGCFVVGVVGSSHKVETVKALGADFVIDKSQEDLWARAKEASPGGYDIVLDANGVETLKKSYESLAPAGRLVVYGFHTMLRKEGGGSAPWLKLARDYLRTPRFNPLDLTNDNKSVLAFNLSYLFDRSEIFEEAMTRLIAWFMEGRVRAPKTTAYPFEKVADAHRALESGQTVGKLVLTF